MPGPFYFAWVTEGTAFNPNVHNVEDEDIFSFRIEQFEGEFPSCEIELANPHVGLLAPSRLRWAYLSYDRAWTPEGSYDVDIVPLFFGRLVGVPNDLQNEILNITLIARPEDYLEQKIAVAATKRVAPYWDPIWFDPDKIDDPDNVLESRPELWHIDRVTHDVSTSNVINGEDGTIELGEGDIFWDGSALTYGETPLRQVDMVARVSWDQAAMGQLNISAMFSFGAHGAIYTYTGKGLLTSWPKSGASLGGGWSISNGSIFRINGNSEPVWGYRIGPAPNSEYPTEAYFRNHNFGPYTAKIVVPSWYENVKPFFQNDFTTKFLYVPIWIMAPTMVVQYDVSRKYNETLNISISADVQSIITDTAGDDYIELTMNSAEVASPIDPAGALPIGDVRRRTYFASDRGEQSIEYLIALMRSQLLIRARTVEITFQIDFPTGVDIALSCRKNVLMTDYRLPGGTAGGKIKSYMLELNGSDGTMLTTIVIGCCIGKDGSIAASAGQPTYVDGYVDGYQTYTGGIIPIAGDVGYTSINGMPVNDDGLNLLNVTAATAVGSILKENSFGAQATRMGTHADDPGTVFDRLEEVPTRFGLTMNDFTGGPFNTVFNVVTTDLKIPKQIDLEAEAVS